MAAAASCAPLSIAEKNGLDMSCTISPICSILSGMVCALSGAVSAPRPNAKAHMLTPRRKFVCFIDFLLQSTCRPIRSGNYLSTPHQTGRERVAYGR